MNVNRDLQGGPGFAPSGGDWAAGLASVLSDPAKLRPQVQPIIDLKRGAVAGYEFLTRFDHPLGESPAEWFATAYALGCVDRLDAVILAAARRLLHKLPANTFLSVNLTSQGAVSRAVLDALHEGPPLDPMVIEFTEQNDVDDVEQLAAAAEKLRLHGAMVAIDDAGAGYAGLQRILAVRPEFIKIDRSLVSRVHRDPARAATVEMLGSLADRMDAWIVAEGVERQAELERLMAIGVPLGQGFLLAEPSSEFEQPDTSWVRRGPAAARHHSPDCVAPMVETVPPALDRAASEELDWRFADDGALDFLPVVDQRYRPVALIERDAREPSALLRVLPSTLTSDALRRAFTRARDARLVPLVCCDEVGRYVGLVGVERMVEHLIDGSDGSSDPGAAQGSEDG